MVNVNVAGFSTSELPNQGYRIFLALVIMIIVSGSFVTIRMATRISNRQLGADDYTIVAALVCGIGLPSNSGGS